MRGKTFILVMYGFLAGLGMISLASGQEGHPMTGSWVGDWGIGNQARNRVVIILDWTGSNLVGTINPGANAIPIKTATVNTDDWSLHLEAEGKDVRGRDVAYIIDGAIDDLGSYNRSIAGTWQSGSQTGDFSITRQ